MRILIIEDDNNEVRNMVWAIKPLPFCDEVHCEVARTIEEVLEFFEPQQEQFDGIILDACLNKKGVIDTYFVFPKLKRIKFQGIILANSSDPGFNTKLMESGATHLRRREKGEGTLDIIQIFLEKFFADPDIPEIVFVEIAKLIFSPTNTAALWAELKKLRPGDRRKIGHALIRKMNGDIPDILKNAPTDYFANLASNLIQGRPL